MKRNIRRALVLWTALLTCFLGWTVQAEPATYTRPAGQPQDLTALLEKPSWMADDYRTLAGQTGLAPAALDLLREQGELAVIPAVQQAYFQPVAIQCTVYSLAARSERLVDGRNMLVALEDGDILLTPCSHVFGWRNGHAALVVDAQAGVTLEAATVGQASALGSLDKWARTPAVAVYRLRGADAATRAAVARAAVRRLTGVPYALTVGLFSDKHPTGAVQGTQCAHLVWEAYAAFGYDLDANGGPIVTPGDLARSPLLELKQVCGLPLAG